MRAFREADPAIDGAPVPARVVRSGREQHGEPRATQALERRFHLEDDAVGRIVRVEEIARDRDEVDRLLRGDREVDRALERAEEIAGPLLAAVPQ